MAFENEVGGLAFDTQVNSGVYVLPSFIPAFDYGSRHLQGLNKKHYPAVALTLADILKGYGVKKKAGSLHELEIKFQYGLRLQPAFKGREVILFLTGPDTLIEHVWSHREATKFFKAVKSMGINTIVGFNFSVIEGECPWSHALAQKKSLYACKLAEEAGLKSIPHVYAINDFHIRKYIEWFKQNPNVKYFAVNAQLQGTGHDIQTVIKSVTTILNEVPHLHVVLQGFHYSKLDRFGSLLDRIHLVDKAPIKNAHSKQRYTLLTAPRLMLKPSYKLPSQTVSDLIIHNCAYRKLHFEVLKQLHISGYKMPSSLLRLIDRQTRSMLHDMI